MSRPQHFLNQLLALDYNCRNTSIKQDDVEDYDDDGLDADGSSVDDVGSEDFFADEVDENTSHLDDPTTCSSGVFNSETESTVFARPSSVSSSSIENGIASFINLPLAIPFFWCPKSDPLQPQQTEEKILSNADIVLCAHYICDDFLIQDVFEKMSLCQLAVPIIVPFDGNLTFQLWAARTIKKQWNQSAEKGLKKVQEGTIARQKLSYISFCRIGKTKISKSKLANSFLSSAQGGTEHSFFIHRDIDSKAELTEGTLEVHWYCPEGRDKEKLCDVTGLYNLRGDARDNIKQFDFLSQVSSVIVILMDNFSLNEKEKEILTKVTDCHIIYVIFNHGTVKANKQMTKLFANKMNSTDLCNALCKIIIKNTAKKLSLEEHAAFAEKLLMKVDETENVTCQQAKKVAKDFVNKLKKIPFEKLKENVVPLQGKHWKEWAKLDKEESRQQNIGVTDVQTYSSSLRDKKKRERIEQVKQGASSEMKEFIEYVANRSICKYFLQWCQMELNEISEQLLPPLMEDYNKSRNELSLLNKTLEDLVRGEMATTRPNKADIEKAVESESLRLKDLSLRFSMASFGIEHLFREFSQLYEGHEETSQTRRQPFSYLPMLMAELFLMGYPLEIMDGDTSHVPLTWVTNVFKEFRKLLDKNPVVYVLSVLGIQSSGKSTLLNTIFGSKFAVASGRCTRGVFLQLLPVCPNFRQILNCDYFIIMDSEGLRSPELSGSVRHDNEIATLVACLANTTVINFWGQTFSKDMDDIMQIVAHAYIRMKEVKIKSSFHLIFAGVNFTNIL